MAVEVTLGTRMSCISSVSRGEDNGSDDEDNLDDGQQGRTPPRLSVPCGNRPIQTDMHASTSFVGTKRTFDSCVAMSAFGVFHFAMQPIRHEGSWTCAVPLRVPMDSERVAF